MTVVAMERVWLDQVSALIERGELSDKVANDGSTIRFAVNIAVKALAECDELHRLIAQLADRVPPAVADRPDVADPAPATSGPSPKEVER